MCECSLDPHALGRLLCLDGAQHGVVGHLSTHSQLICLGFFKVGKHESVAVGARPGSSKVSARDLDGKPNLHVHGSPAVASVDVLGTAMREAAQDLHKPKEVRNFLGSNDAFVSLSMTDIPWCALSDWCCREKEIDEDNS